MVNRLARSRLSPARAARFSNWLGCYYWTEFRPIYDYKSIDLIESIKLSEGLLIVLLKVEYFVLNCDGASFKSYSGVKPYYKFEK